MKRMLKTITVVWLITAAFMPAKGRCQVVRAIGQWPHVDRYQAIRSQALNGLVTDTDRHVGRDRPHAATANAVVSETTSHSRQRRRITVR